MVNLEWSGLVLLAESAAENTSQSPTEQLLEFVNSHPIFGWLFAVLFFIATVMGAIATVIGAISNITKYFRKSEAVTPEQLQKYRQSVISKVGRRIAERRSSSLNDLNPVTLERSQTIRQGNQRKNYSAHKHQKNTSFLNRVFSQFGHSKLTEVKPDQPTIEIFEHKDVKGRLLILGDAGSGKTNELLTLADDLLYKCSSVDEPIPVIFELSEWTEKFEFEEWLGQQLLENYQVPLTVSEIWIRNSQLLPLLDGLDELRRIEEESITPEDVDRLRKDKQVKCVEAINDFLAGHRFTKLVVCCRNNEYESLNAEREFGNFKGEIYLKPLENQQIEDYLVKDLQKGWLWNELQSQPQLLDLVKSPLFLMMLVVAYSQRERQPIRSEKELVEAYITAQLRKSRRSKHYSDKKARHYLGWLATRLESFGQAEFLIERLQPYWFERKSFIQEYRIILCLMAGFCFGIPCLLITSFRYGLFLGISLSIFLGLWIAICSVFMTQFDFFMNIVPRESISISWHSIRMDTKDLIYQAPSLLMFTLFLSFVYWVFEPIREMQYELDTHDFFDINLWLYAIQQIAKKAGVFMLTCVYGFTMIAIILIFLAFLRGIRLNALNAFERDRPNQGIITSLKNGSSSMILFTALAMLFAYVFKFVSEQKVFSSIFFDPLSIILWAILIGLFFGLSTSLKHISLRIILWRYGFSPWDYEKFLEHASEYRFVQRVGGRYRFAHDLLRKQFAETYRETSS